MAFVPKQTRKKAQAVYKTIYLPQEIVDRVNEIALQDEASFNNVVASMIDHCLNEE